MFTGIIERLGVVSEIVENGTNKSFWIKSSLSNELKIDQSISHNGICLTVEEIDGDMHKVTAIEETIKKTNIGHWQSDAVINLERCMMLNGRIDGHIVQGHVDTTAKCISVKDANGSWEYTFEFDPSFAALIIEKGSICLNGISLTLFNVTKSNFTVAIIPYTYHHTNMQQINRGYQCNVEFDMIGKYVNRFQQLKQSNDLLQNII